jgi:hypothetical protein
MVGLVAALGSDVQHLKIGQRVGIGWQYSSCKSCKYCDAEQETVCPKVSNFRVNGRFEKPPYPSPLLLLSYSQIFLPPLLEEVSLTVLSGTLVSSFQFQRR